MKTNMIWANVSVKDTSRTKAFYTKLGITPNGSNTDPQLASFKFGEHGFVIHFFQQGSQIDEYITPAANNTSGIIFTLSADSEAEVKEWEAKVKAAGGTVFKAANRDEAGYLTLGFADPDGHRFNVLLMDNM